jgi:hypothetical protein
VRAVFPHHESVPGLLPDGSGQALHEHGHGAASVAESPRVVQHGHVALPTQQHSRVYKADNALRVETATARYVPGLMVYKELYLRSKDLWCYMSPNKNRDIAPSSHNSGY